jgi:hypothetical protein
MMSSWSWAAGLDADILLTRILDLQIEIIRSINTIWFLVHKPIVRKQGESQRSHVSKDQFSVRRNRSALTPLILMIYCYIWASKSMTTNFCKNQDKQGSFFHLSWKPTAASPDATQEPSGTRSIRELFPLFAVFRMLPWQKLPVQDLDETQLWSTFSTGVYWKITFFIRTKNMLSRKSALL